MVLLVLAIIAADPTADDVRLINAGKALGVRSIATGTLEPTLQALAQEQAAYCARMGQGGHQLFGRQFEQHYRRYPGLRSIVAESWPGQSADAAAKECYNSWRQSSGHWRSCNGPCRYWGFSMVRGRNGIWYGAGYFSD